MKILRSEAKRLAEEALEQLKDHCPSWVAHIRTYISILEREAEKKK